MYLAGEDKSSLIRIRNETIKADLGGSSSDGGEERSNSASNIDNTRKSNNDRGRDSNNDNITQDPNSRTNRFLKRPASPPVEEMTSESIRIANRLIHNIDNTVPIKLASPTSVVPGEATSTIQDDTELEGGSPPARKQLSFNLSDPAVDRIINNVTPAESPDLLFGEGEERVEPPLLRTGTLNKFRCFMLICLTGFKYQHVLLL